MTLSRFEMLALIPDKDVVTVYYPNNETEKVVRVRRGFAELMSQIPDDIGYSQFCAIPKQPRLGMLVWVGAAKQRGKSHVFCFKPDPKKLKKMQKLYGWKFPKQPARVEAKV